MPKEAQPANPAKITALAIPEAVSAANPALLYVDALREYLTNPEITSQRVQVGSIDYQFFLSRDKRLVALQQSLDGLKKGISESRRAAQIARNEYANLGTIAVLRHWALDSIGLRGLAGRISPVNLREAEHQRLIIERKTTEAAIEQTREDLRHERDNLLGQKRSGLLSLRNMTETWAIEDRNRLLAYVTSSLQNEPQEINKLFAAYVQNQRGDPQEIAQRLREDYAVLTGSVIAEAKPKQNGSTDVKNTKRDGSAKPQRDHQEEVQNDKEKKEEIQPLDFAILVPPQAGLGYGQIPVQEEQIATVVRESGAKVIAGNKQRAMIIEQLVRSIREHPYGQGNKNLSGNVISLNYQRLSLRRLDPRKVPGISLGHDENLKGARIVYVIFGSNGRKAIVLEGIYTHGDFNKRFGIRVEV